jgi:branched-chain amino acid transport system permease protein
MTAQQAKAETVRARRKGTLYAALQACLTGKAYTVLACVVIAATALTPVDAYQLNILLETATYAFAVLGISVVLGLCGQITLTQAAFFGLGAYGVGLGTVYLHWPFWPCLLGGLAMAVAAGALLGASTLRLGGHYLAMVTISFQVIVNLIMTNAVWLTNGPDGVRGIARPAFFESTQAYLGLCVGILAAAGYWVWRLPDTRLGRAMRAVRDNELAARVAGVNAYQTKLVAFAISALLGGLGGGLFASGFTYVSPDQFSYNESAVFLTMSLLGGVASPIGSAIGTALLVLLPEWLRFLNSVPGLYLAIYGLGVIFIIVFMPSGIWGFAVSMARRGRSAAAVITSVPELRLSPSNSGGEYVLQVTSLSKNFGGLKAVDDVDLAVRRGTIHALIGPNGSGKTTLLNLLSGIYPSSSGTIRLDGRDITRLPVHARIGFGRTFQNIRLFRSMTALENVVVGAEQGAARASGHAALVERAVAALAFVGLEKRADETVTTFSYGHQRLIEIARALAADPALLLLDEPAAGLNATEKLEIQNLLERVSAQGLTVLIIDHDISLVRNVAQHITVLNFGRRIADGESMSVLNHADVISAYLGSD